MKLEKGQKVQLGGAGVNIEAVVVESSSEGFKFVEVATKGRSSLTAGFYSYIDQTITLSDEVPVDSDLEHFIDNSDSELNSPKNLLRLTTYIMIGIWVLFGLLWYFSV